MTPNIQISADEALERLLEGNRRFAAGTNIHPRESPARRIEISSAPQPFAIVLGCSDSRVPPEIVFDQGLGDLYVVRVPGHFVNDAVVGSLEHALESLGARLILVLGHQRCGLVTALMEGHKVSEHVFDLVRLLQPVATMVGRQPVGQVENAVRANIQFAVAKLKINKPVIQALVDKKELKVVGAYYEVDSGAVKVIA